MYARTPFDEQPPLPPTRQQQQQPPGNYDSAAAAAEPRYHAVASQQQQRGQDTNGYDRGWVGGSVRQAEDLEAAPASCCCLALTLLLLTGSQSMNGWLVGVGRLYEGGPAAAGPVPSGHGPQHQEEEDEEWMKERQRRLSKSREQSNGHDDLFFAGAPRTTAQAARSTPSQHTSCVASPDCDSS